VTVIVLYVFARAGSAGSRIKYVFTSRGSPETAAICGFAILRDHKHTEAVCRSARAECVLVVFLEYGICGMHIWYARSADCFLFFSTL
jgi:hypothetical protein